MADNYIVKDGANEDLTVASKDTTGTGVHAPKVAVVDASGNQLGITGSPVVVGDGGSTISIDDGAGAITVDGTVAISGTVAVTDNASTLSVDDGGGALTVDGTVAVSSVSGNVTAVGAAASGAAASGNPVLVAGTDSTNARTLLTDSTGRLSVIGPVAHDGANVGYAPLLLGGTSSAAAPSDVSDDGDSVKLWALRNGALATQITNGGTLVSPATETTLSGVLTTTAFQARVPANGQAAMAASVPVVIASNQTAVAVTDSQFTLTAPVGAEVTATTTALVTFSSTTVKAPVNIQIAKGMTQSLTIKIASSGNTIAVLEWDDATGHHNPSVTLAVANMNQLAYQAALVSTTEVFRWNSSS